MTPSKQRFVAFSLAIALCTTSFVIPRRTEAALGVLVTIAPSLVISPVFIPLYYLLAVAGGASAVDQLDKARTSGDPWKYVQAGFMAAFGAVMLNAPASGSMDYAPISDAVAEQAGLTVAERAAYASELPMLNAIREESFARMESKFSKSRPTLGEVAEELRSQWRELSRQALSPEAASAMEKLAASVRNPK